MMKVKPETLDQLIEFSKALDHSADPDGDLERMRNNPDLWTDPDFIEDVYEPWIESLRGAIIFGGGVVLSEIVDNDKSRRRLIKQALKRAGLSTKIGI